MNTNDQLLPSEESTNIKQMVLETNIYGTKHLGFYRGIVIQNNDPERRGRVKVYIPALAPQIKEWYGESSDVDKSFRFPAGSNIYKDKASLSSIEKYAKKIIPWAEQAASLVGSGSSGVYSAKDDIATISDSSTNKLPGAGGSLNVDGIGEKPGFLYETPTGQLKDGFGAFTDDMMPESNPYAFQFKPSTYSNCTKGLFAVPDVGASVWIFFENGSIETPIYFAYSYDKNDWQKINEMVNTDIPNAGINYPGAYENSGSNDPQKYKKGKMVLNSKGGTIEVVDTDNNESLKLTHPSGSFIQMHKLAYTTLCTGNDQKLILKSQFETVENSKNVHVRKVYNIGVDETRWCRIGDWKNINAYQQWVELNRPIADTRARFAIKRSAGAPLVSSLLPPAGSISQTQEGTFADNPILAQTPVAVTSAPIPNEIYVEMPKASDLTGNQASTLETAVKQVSEPSSFAQPATIPPEEFLIAAGESGSNNFSGTDAELSSSTQDGEWAPDTEYNNLKDLETAQSERMLQYEKKFGNGGDDNTQIIRHKYEIVGAAFNDSPSVRVDPVGRMEFNEMLICSETVFASQKPSPLVERVANDGKYPCGNYTLTICNGFYCTAGSGGIGLRTTGTFDIAGSQVVVSGSNEIIVSSSGDVKITSGGRFNVTADVITLSQTQNKQVGIDCSLGVKNNVVIGGGTYVEGELYVNHVTAPAEIQETELIEVYGRPDNIIPKVIGFVFVVNTWLPVYSCVPAAGLFNDPDSIITVPHSHNFRNLPLNLVDNNISLRRSAMQMNKGTTPAVAGVVTNGKKEITEVAMPESENFVDQPIFQA